MIKNEAKLQEAYRWLDKAIAYEEQGKGAKIVEMSLDKAVKLEAEAFT